MPQRRASLAGAVTYAVERLRCRLPRRGVQHVPERLRCPVQCVAIVVIEPFIEQQALDFQQCGEYGVAVHPGSDI
jgi:hypothetical protein